MILPLIAIVVVGLLALWLIGAVFWMLLSTLAVGLVMGALGRLVVPGRQPIGLLATVLIGFAGAIVGSLIGHAIGLAHGFTLLLEVGASALLVAGYSGSRRRQLAGRRPIGRGW